VRAVALWFMCLVGGGLGNLMMAGQALAQETGCPQPVDSTPLSYGEPPTPVTLIPEVASGLLIPFDRSREAQTGVFFLDPGEDQTLPDVGTVLEITRRPLDRQQVYGQIRGGSYFVSAVVTRRQEVTVTVCFDPATLDVGQGTYAGSVRIQDPRVEDVSIPLTMTFQYPRSLWMTILYAAFILSLGSAFVWATAQRTAGKTLTDRWWNDLLSWFTANLVSLVPAAIAAGGVFLARYWRDPSWGAKAPEDWFTLLGAMFTAYAAALAAASATISKRSDARDGDGVAAAAGTSPEEPRDQAATTATGSRPGTRRSRSRRDEGPHTVAKTPASRSGKPDTDPPSGKESAS
jgi:hypothetical protein